MLSKFLVLQETEAGARMDLQSEFHPAFRYCGIFNHRSFARLDRYSAFADSNYPRATLRSSDHCIGILGYQQQQT